MRNEQELIEEELMELVHHKIYELEPSQRKKGRFTG